MKRSIKAIALIMMLVAALSVLFIPSKVYAAGSDTAVVAETNDKDVTVAKAYAAAIVVAAVAAAGAIAMGLAICKSIAERCGGEIGVNSEGEGKGSTFWMRIPCVRKS